MSAASLREFMGTRPLLSGAEQTQPGEASRHPEPRPLAELAKPNSTEAPEGTSVTGPFVVDGSNLAYGAKGKRGKASLARLYTALEELRRQHPGVEAVVVVDANFRHVVADEERAEVDREIADGVLHRVPSRTVGGADVYVLEIARRKSWTVVSNDGFGEHTDHHSWLSQPGRLLGAEEIAGMWVFKERRPSR
ncbi:hypothetical protein HFP72_04420 [Nocardiopsis sp. ARC36]